ncbi:MAG: peptidoglycan-associated lipoprotein Pal [Gemmatimonadetes bacterium]|nr:peptidoglycan-associated lipoprotein Pal [Gemmatimonadota bacterium]
MLVSRRTSTALLLAIVSLTACKAKPAPTPVPVAPPVAVAPKFNKDSADAAEAKKRADAAAAKAAAEAAANASAAIAKAKATLGQIVYFDYDKDEIRDDQKATIEAKLPILEANPTLRIRVAGHTDNRGSDEYNLTLGQKRAAAVKRYLAARGIADARVETVSFGEERPAVQGENEDAWGKNRRAEFEILSGGDTMKAPK